MQAAKINYFWKIKHTIGLLAMYGKIVYIVVIFRKKFMTAAENV